MAVVFSSGLRIELQTAAEPNVMLTAALGLSPKQLIKNANGFPEQRVHRAKQSEQKVNQVRSFQAGETGECLWGRRRGLVVSERRPPEVVEKDVGGVSRFHEPC